MPRPDRPLAVHIPRSWVPAERNFHIPLCGSRGGKAYNAAVLIAGPGLVATATCSNCLRIQAHHDRSPLPTLEDD